MKFCTFDASDRIVLHLLFWENISILSFIRVTGNEKSLSNKSSISSDLSPSPSYYMPTSQFFDWNAYLKETSSEAAPAFCFKQVR